MADEAIKTTGKAEVMKKAAARVLQNEQELDKLVCALSGSSRLARQNAAQVLALAAKENPGKLASRIADLVDALNRPEAQTRWECLNALTSLVDFDVQACESALPGADAALFDEESGLLRLSAMRFLCKMGAVSEALSEKTWPLIDEGIQCYHGDLEFSDMLSAVTEFAQGNLSSHVKEKLVARMKFDAENGKGALKRRAAAIIECAS